MRDLQIARNELEAILEQGITTPQDFTAMAVAGETLRCLGISQGVKPPMVLTVYYVALQHHRDLAPINLGAHLKRAVEQLEEYSLLPEGSRGHAVGEQLLTNMTRVMLLVSAYARASILTFEEGRDICEIALVEMRRLAPRLPELWDAAEMASNSLCCDDRIPWVLDYLEPLAQLSSLRAK